MKIENMVIKTREPILTLRMGSGYSDEHDLVKIYYSDVKKAKLGKVWKTKETHITRDAMEQLAKIVYKDIDGAVILLKTNFYDDSEEPEVETRYDLLYVPFEGDENE
ncbi:MAG: hypothetical protein QXU79_04035 [Candidatus Micrarchaeaceae archaeon]